MAKKEVSAIVSGMGVGMAILTSLMEKAKKRGLSEESIHRLATPQGDALLDKMVAVLTEATAAVGNAFRVLVNYDLRADAAIGEGKYDYANDNITEKNFPTTRKGTAKLDIVLVHLNRDISSEDAIKELDKLGLRPAELHELLAFGAKYPDEQRKYPIVALGSVWRYLFGRNVPYLWLDDGGRRLGLLWFGPGWRAYYRFAGVRK
mgnify:CR=1 FL=1